MTKDEVKEMIDTTICSNKYTPITGEALNLALTSIVDLVGEGGGNNFRLSPEDNVTVTELAISYSETITNSRDITNLLEYDKEKQCFILTRTKYSELPSLGSSIGFAFLVSINDEVLWYYKYSYGYLGDSLKDITCDNSTLYFPNYNTLSSLSKKPFALLSTPD